MKIHVFNVQKDLRIQKMQVRALVATTLHFLSIRCEEIAIYFVSKRKIASLHGEYFQDPSPTDCITFPLNREYLGEIFVCPLVAKEYALERTLDPHEELSLYIVHGILHLLGYDDLKPQDKKAMRKKEKSCMQYLKAQNMLLHL